MFKFLEGLDKDIQQTVLEQLRDLWTHSSTAIEGNTLTLGDTKFVLSEGLTVSGKPIKDHQEVIGHAKAIELMYSLVGTQINTADIFNLHKAIQTESVQDIYKPNGAWKVEPNGTYAVDEKGSQIYIEYAHPNQVQPLMQEVISEINYQQGVEIGITEAPQIYAKIHMGIAHIHPFWDGNGRVARLLSNLPLLSSGLPPIMIQKEDRREYIETLARYQQAVGVLTEKTGVWPKPELLNEFIQFCRNSYSATQTVIDAARQQQQQRNNMKV